MPPAACGDASILRSIGASGIEEGDDDHCARHHACRRGVHREHETLQYAAQRMRDLDVRALPVCDDNEMLRGIITDRDIMTKCVASGADPAGMITEADLARHFPEQSVGPFVEAVCAS